MNVNWSELLYANAADFTAFANSAAEGSLLAASQVAQPSLPPFFFGPNSDRKCLLLKAAGVLSTTGTPTIIFQVRMGTTAGSAQLGGASLGVSAAITTASGITSQRWELEMLMQCYRAGGYGAGNTTLSCSGKVQSPGGFASPFIYDLEPTTPATATWTATFDASVAQFLNVSVTWSAMSASNTITAKSLVLLALN